MTTRELKKYIRKQVRKANTRIRNINKRKRGVSKAVQQELDYLKRYGIIGKRGKAVTGYRTAKKPELIMRARELEYFNQWTGAESKAIAKEKDYKKYQTFINNNPDFSEYSYQEWRELVNVFGSLDSDLKAFEYEDTKRLHLEATQKGVSKDFLSAMKEASNKAKDSGKVMETEDLTDLLRGELFV